MRDEQVRRYARHILLPDVGGLGQTALLVSSASLDLPSSFPLGSLPWQFPQRCSNRYASSGP